MDVIEVRMQRKKSTDYKVRFRDNLDRIGNVYLPKPTVERMNIGDEIIIQVTAEKSYFEPGGYISRMVKDKETAKKVRFEENITEGGELGIIYVSKEVLKNIGITSEEIAVRIIKPEKEV